MKPHLTPFHRPSHPNYKTVLFFFSIRIYASSLFFFSLILVTVMTATSSPPSKENDYYNFFIYLPTPDQTADEISYQSRLNGVRHQSKSNNVFKRLFLKLVYINSVFRIIDSYITSLK